MDKYSDFDRNMKQLIQLLKKILRGHIPHGQFSELQNIIKEQGINLNLFFFTFLPVSAQELDELEEIYDRYLLDEDKTPEELTDELSASDLDFLRRHGIRF